MPRFEACAARILLYSPARMTDNWNNDWDEIDRWAERRRIAEQEVQALDATTRGYYEAYADGVNAYLADHDGAAVSLEYAILGMQNSSYEIEPWTPADSVAWLKAMAWDLRGNVEEETERAILAQTLSPEQIAERDREGARLVRALWAAGFAKDSLRVNPSHVDVNLLAEGPSEDERLLATLLEVQEAVFGLTPGSEPDIYADDVPQAAE